MKETKFKEVLIFVAGATPQIITETIYALSQKTSPIYPDEIYIITTAIGRKRIEETLIKGGILRDLIMEYNLPRIEITKESFVIVKDLEDKELDDIRNELENEAMGDLITSFIKEKAKDPNARLHCSLAGGRKTMSFYMGSALQLFGRPWDKLYHVLVTPEFESNPDFYYIPKKDRKLTLLTPPLDKGGYGGSKELHTKNAEIFLAELPFIRLKDKIPLNDKGFKELVEEGQKEIDTALTQPSIRVNLKERIITIRDRDIEFKPFHLVLYTYLLKQKIERCPYPERTYCLNCVDCFPQIADISSPRVTESMAKDYEAIYGPHSGHVENFKKQWKEGVDAAKLRSDRSKINKEIIESLEDDTLATYYTITSLRKWGGTRFGIKVEKGKIKIE